MAACVRDARALRRRSAMCAGWASPRACPPVAAPSDMAIRFLRRDGVPMAWLNARQSVLCVEATVVARGHCVVGSAAARHCGRRPPAFCCKRERCDSTSRSATAAAARLQRGGVGPRGDGAVARARCSSPHVRAAVRDDAACGWRGGGGSAAAWPRRRARTRCGGLARASAVSTKSFWGETAHSGRPP